MFLNPQWHWSLSFLRLWLCVFLSIFANQVLYRQIVVIPMGTNCALLVANLFLFCYERDFMLSQSDNNQTDINEAFNSTSRYLDDLLNIDNPYFETNGRSDISH